MIVNGSVTFCVALSPLSVCRPGMVVPSMSSGLNAVIACSEYAPFAFGWTEKPSRSGSLSSKILPLQVSGWLAADAPPAPWKPIVAVWP